MIKEIDEIDLRILECMQQNAKLTLEEISKSVDLSTSAVAKRIVKLEGLNVVTSYTVVLNRDLLGLKFASSVGVKLISNTNANLTRFKERILELSEVISCCVVSGDYDFILKVLVRDSVEYNYFCNNCLGSNADIASIHSSVIVEEVKGRIGMNPIVVSKKSTIGLQTR